MRKNVLLQDEANIVFEALKDSGITNMLGAAPHAAETLGVSLDEARRLHKGWMEGYTRWADLPGCIIEGGKSR